MMIILCVMLVCDVNIVDKSHEGVFVVCKGVRDFGSVLESLRKLFRL